MDKVVCGKCNKDISSLEKCYCKTCNKYFDYGCVKFPMHCVLCGSELTEVAEPAAEKAPEPAAAKPQEEISKPAELQEPPLPLLQCRKCGEANKPGFLRCTKCDARLRPRILGVIPSLVIIFATLFAIDSLRSLILFGGFRIGLLVEPVIAAAAILILLAVRDGYYWAWRMTQLLMVVIIAFSWLLPLMFLVLAHREVEILNIDLPRMLFRAIVVTALALPFLLYIRSARVRAFCSVRVFS